MAGNVALVRRPSSRMADGITTHIVRVHVDAGLAARQHEAYVGALAGAGFAIREVAPADDLPDCAFVEDTVVVLGDLAVLARPGATERRAEVAGTDAAVRSLGLDVARIEEPGTLDGPRPRQHSQIVKHDDRVLDERAVRQIIGLRQLADRPTRAAERVDVRLVLAQRERRVGGHAIDVRRDALRHPAARPPHERRAHADRLRHGATAGTRTRGRLPAHRDVAFPIA